MRRHNWTGEGGLLMTYRGLGLLAALAVIVGALGTGGVGLAVRPLPAQEASPGASATGSPAASPVDSTAGLLATVNAQGTATALAATAQAAAAPQQTVSAISTQNAEIQVALAALATREADSAQEAAMAEARASAAEATIATLSTAQANAQATMTGLGTAEADARATAAALSTAVAEVTATANAVPTATPEPTATPTPMPTPTPVPEAGDVLYETGESGLEDWPASQEWKTVAGMLVNDGTVFDYDRWLKAPFTPGQISDYAVEAEIQYVRGNGIFGVVARADDNEGYRVGVNWSNCTGGPNAGVAESGNAINYCQFLDASRWEADSEWHTYRAEVQGNTIAFFMDGNLLAETTDNQFLAGGQVGLFSSGCQITVRSVRVIAL